MLLLACGVEKLDDEEPLIDVLDMRVDGAPYHVDSVIAPDQVDLDSHGWIVGLDDALADPRRNDPNWEKWVFAQDDSGLRFYFNTRAALGTGRKTLNRAYQPRQGVPWMALLRWQGDQLVESYLPRDGSAVEILEVGGERSRLEVRFERVVLVDACDQEKVLENGRLGVGLVTTEGLLPDAFYRLEDEGLEGEQVEGGGGFVIAGQGPFNALPPYSSHDTADDLVTVSLTNDCDDTQHFFAYIPATAELGDYAVQPQDPPLWLVFDQGTPFDYDDDARYLAVSGTVRLVEISAAGGFVSGSLESPIVFARLPPGSTTLDMDDTLRAESGWFRSWVY